MKDDYCCVPFAVLVHVRRYEHVYVANTSLVGCVFRVVVGFVLHGEVCT